MGAAAGHQFLGLAIAPHSLSPSHTLHTAWRPVAIGSVWPTRKSVPVPASQTMQVAVVSKALSGSLPQVEILSLRFCMLIIPS